jgi:hypothetical protein
MAVLHKLCAKYPHLSTVIGPCASLVAQLRESLACPDGPYELETRLGHSQSHGFATGVARETMDAIIEMMQSSPYVSGDDEWTECQDFLYTHNNIPHRTRVLYNTDDMSTQSTTIVKESIRKLDVGTNNGSDIRVSLKKEVEVPSPETCVATNLVRIKQQRRFKTLDKVWSFDFALVWSGRTKTEAEEMQCTKDPEFEIECELIDPAPYLAVHDDAYVATSLLLKMCDLLGPAKGDFWVKA